ncbi:MAG: hypothetical protein M1814_001638 [Vezdaea aestivalis]|nr:MAG: hypothetical protein M1814_001638 [Vezdaea aestivalis]
MASFPQTPQRPIPGQFLATPAIGNPKRQSLRQATSNAPQSVRALAERAIAQPGLGAVAPIPPPQPTLSPIQRAARTINETLIQEGRSPALEQYVGQGISSDYDLPHSPAWTPFQKTRVYEIPERIFEQYNQAQVSTIMGLLAELNHAWIAIDNCLYLWNYTLPDPELVGFEDQPNTITGVRLTRPRAGVFLASVTHLLIIATTSEIHLVGISTEPNPASGYSITLFRTQMNVSIRGMDVQVVEGSPSDGRIFFANRGDNDVYELTYQQEERWFSNRVGKVNHTSKGFHSLAPSITASFTNKTQEHIVQMVNDSSRSLLYTLSSKSTIRVFSIRPNGGLDLMIQKTLGSTLSYIHHMVSSTRLLGPSVPIVSISPITSQEASKLHLMATTSTGCRIFFSATAATAWGVAEASSAPTNMQVHHVRFPPTENSPDAAASTPNNQLTYPTNVRPVDSSSTTLFGTTSAKRYAPGYFVAIKTIPPQSTTDAVFLSAPESARIPRPQELAGTIRYHEYGNWLAIDSRAEDIGLISPPFSAAPTPTGFGNELAVQFDDPATEIAILTNTGIHTVRRRRLVDLFAAVLGYGTGHEGLELEIKRFISFYGRGEVCATALAVACGQGINVADYRTSRVTDPEVTSLARRTFVEYGGKATLDANAVVDQTLPIDSFIPSPRHDGLALYVSRLVRSVWKKTIVLESTTPTGGLTITPVVKLQKLQTIQSDLTKLQEFLNQNKTLIDGLSGPESLQQATNMQEEIALQAEHRALHSLVVLISNLIEGISFVLVLFDERVDEIILSLSAETRRLVQTLTFEALFSSPVGKDVAKDLVKAIVNRNIAKGSNVDTVAGALRRRCGSFCGANDVTIFKAQEQLIRASDAGPNSDHGRNLLNESLRLFKSVAGSLSMEHLQQAVEQYIGTSFFAGAISLCLLVAKGMDSANLALSWITDGRPAEDPRRSAFDSRQRCYELIHQILTSVDNSMQRGPAQIDGQPTMATRRRDEAYSQIDNSDDEVFQTDLYDWYRSRGLTDRLLEVRSPYIVNYLRRLSEETVADADLLWRYFAQSSRYFDAAGVQLQLAKSTFLLPLEKRIEYLSQAKANASTQTSGVGRQTRQLLVKEISDQLEVANIQGDILQRHASDDRHTDQSRAAIVDVLNGPILTLTELFNKYADGAGYYDICLLIYEEADHRNPNNIRATWSNLIRSEHEAAVEKRVTPWEAVAETVRKMGQRLHLSESTFPVPVLVPLLETYAAERQHNVGPSTWVMDVFLNIGVEHETLVSVLSAMFQDDEPSADGRNRRVISSHLLYVIGNWYSESMREGRTSLFGSEATARQLSEILESLPTNGLSRAEADQCRALITKIGRNARI